MAFGYLQGWTVHVVWAQQLATLTAEDGFFCLDRNSYVSVCAHASGPFIEHH